MKNALLLIALIITLFALDIAFRWDKQPANYGMIDPRFHIDEKGKVWSAVEYSQRSKAPISSH